MTATITYTDLQAGARPAGRWLLGAGQTSPPIIITSREESASSCGGTARTSWRSACWRRTRRPGCP